MGTPAAMTIWRGGREYAVRIPIEVAPETTPRDVTRLSGSSPLEGATVANLSPALLEELSLDGPSSGVVVVSVAPRSIAQRIGLQTGDIVSSVNGREIRRVADLRSAVSGRASNWRIAIQRNGRTFNLSIG